MKPRHPTRTTLFAASKRLGSVRVCRQHRVFRHVHRANRTIPRTGQSRQEINALGRSIFHECDLHGRETHTWGIATYPIVQGYDAYGNRDLLCALRDAAAGFNASIFPNATTDQIWENIKNKRPWDCDINPGHTKNLIAQNAQCTTWVLEVLSSAGINLPFVVDHCDLGNKKALNPFQSQHPT